MKTIAMTMEVYDDTDIFELHEELIEQFGDTSELCIYESVDALIRDHATTTTATKEN